MNKEIGKENYNIIGVPSYIAVTNTIGEDNVRKLMPKLRMYSDTKNDLFYFRPTPDHKRFYLVHFLFGHIKKKIVILLEIFFIKISQMFFHH